MKTSPESKTAYKDDSSNELTAANPSTKDARTADAKSNGNFNLILIVAAVAVTLAAIWWLTQRPSENRAAVNSITNTVVNRSTNPMPDQKPPTMTDVPVGGAQSPTEAYRMLFAAVKSQDPSKIKLMLTQGSMGLAQMAAGQQKKSVEEVIKNGFTETTFADDYPQIRDERIKDNMGAVEVWNAGRKQWEDLPFMLEDGSWKLAIGDAFAGKFKSPGKGMAVVEQENANANNPNAMIQRLPAPNANTNGNFTSGGKVTKPKNQ